MNYRRKSQKSMDDEVDDIVAGSIPEKTLNWYLVAIVCLATALIVLVGAYLTGSLPGQEMTRPSPSTNTGNNPAANYSRPNTNSAKLNRRVKGNLRSRIYHVPGCKNYDDISESNIEWFNSEDEAVKAGYRKAQNCG